MSKRLTLAMTFIVLAGFGVILLMNIAALVGFFPSRYISPNDVRGMAIEHNQKLYTLNFDQQNQMIDIFNRLIPVSQELIEKRKVVPKKPLEIQKIVIYRFNAPDIEVRPVAFISKSLSPSSNEEEIDSISTVFFVPAWNPSGLLEESATDSAYKTLINTYDP